MKITSIGFLSETLFQQYNGVVQNHGDHTEVRTPANYTFWFGNYLLLEQPPSKAEIPHWIARFTQVFANAPEVKHMCLQWPLKGQNTRSEECVYSGP